MVTGKKTTLVFGALAALAAAAALYHWLPREADPTPNPRTGPAPRRVQLGVPGVAPRLNNTWFVRYRSDPNAYLDVAAVAPSGTELSRVTADLTGPRKVYRDLELKHNAREREWQLICGFLPRKLAGGVWWVSRVRLTTRDGRWAEYHAGAPHETYALDHGRHRQTTARDKKTRIWIGSFYATAAAAARPLYHVHTFPTGGAPSNPVLQIYAAADRQRWIAVNDDPDVNQDYASVTLPLTPGRSYYIRVDDRYGQRGHYGVVVSRSTSPPTARPAPGADPDQYEPDDDPGRASPLVPGKVQVRSFSGRKGIWGDQDWMLLRVPE